MNNNRKHLSIRFNLDDPREKEIWEFLQNADCRYYKSRNNYLVHLLGTFLEEQQAGNDKEPLSDKEIDKIAEAVAKKIEMSGIALQAYQPEGRQNENQDHMLHENETKNKTEMDEIDIEIPDDLLAFGTA